MPEKEWPVADCWIITSLEETYVEIELDENLTPQQNGTALF